MDRALRLAKALFAELASAGHHVGFATIGEGLFRKSLDERRGGGRDRDGYGIWGPDRPTVARIGTVAVGLTIFEFSEEVEVRYVDGKFVRASQAPLSKRIGMYAHSAWTHKRHMPSGKLCLRASSPYSLATWERTWCEVKAGQLRPKLPEIVRELESEAVTIAKLVEEGEKEAEIRRREWEAQAEKWQREEDERRRIQGIKDSREHLFGIIEAWGVATRIEGFFEDIERRAADLAADERQSLLERVRVARLLVGGVDALQRFSVWQGPERL